MKDLEGKIGISEYFGRMTPGNTRPGVADSVGPVKEHSFFDAFIEAFAETVSRTVEEHYMKEAIGDVSVLEKWAPGRNQ